MINLRSEKGSITLFVLISCLFFMASVACVQMYMQSKQTAVDREYRQIKASYEQSVDENAIINAYRQVAQLKDIRIVIENISKTENKLTVQFSLDTTSVTDLEVKTIKYGWGSDSTVDTVTNWTYLERQSVNDKMIAINNNASSSGDYHLFVVVNNQEIYKKITV